MKHYEVKKSKKIIIPIVAIVGIVIIALISFLLIRKTMKKKDAMIMASLPEFEEGLNTDVLLVDVTTEEELWEQIDLMEETEVETEAEKKENGPNSISSKERYYIMVNCLANTVTIYENDGNGNFNPIKAMVCSTGGATPKSGKYTIGAKYSWLPLFGGVYGHYCTRIGTSHILFHSVPYTENYNSGSLEYWEFDKLGTSASMGCIRLQIKDTQWIYSNIPKGTTVEFYSDSNPGPLGKPTAAKISSNTACRNWDPTDDDSANPWRNNNQEIPKEETVVVEVPVTNTETNTNTNTNTEATNNTISEEQNTITNTENIVQNDVIITNTENVIEENIISNNELP